MQRRKGRKQPKMWVSREWQRWTISQKNQRKYWWGGSHAGWTTHHHNLSSQGSSWRGRGLQKDCLWILKRASKHPPPEPLDGHILSALLLLSLWWKKRGSTQPWSWTSSCRRTKKLRQMGRGSTWVFGECVVVWFDTNREWRGAFASTPYVVSIRRGKKQRVRSGTMF